MMKTSTSNLISGRNAASLLIVLGIFFVVGFACGSGTPPPAGYVGAWVGDDGSTITIRGDGSGDYKSGGTTVTGGTVEVKENEKSLTIKMVGIGPSFTIDKAPSGNKMTLSGVVYTKSGGSSDTKSDSKSDAKPEMPSKDKLQTLVKQTFMDFGDAVQSEDFGDFYNKIAKVWRDQTSPEELLKAFKAFVDDKENYDFKRAITPLDATFTPDPAFDKVAGNDALVVKGYYPTKPLRANFEMKYVMDDGSWKLVGINIKTKSE